MTYLELLKAYWWILVIAFLIGIVFACVVIGVFKKKPVLNLLDTVLKEAFKIIPTLCAAVEMPGNGSTKKNYVLKELQLYLFKQFGFKDFETIEPQLVSQIEATLKAPHANVYNTKED